MSFNLNKKQALAGFALLCLSAAVGTASAATVALPQTTTTGFGLTEWRTYNIGADGASAPFSGGCDGGAGLHMLDARGPTGAGDAYDGAWQIYVNGASFVAPGGNVDLTGTTLTAGPVPMSGLQVSVQYYFSTPSAVARILVTMNNPSAAAIVATVEVPVNYGSDSGTVIRATSSGDTLVTTADRWVVSSDSGPSDPVNTVVFYGPGAPRVTPATYTQTVFNCAATNGLGATFSVSVPAGATRSLMFFAGLGGVTVNDNLIASAQTAAALFNSNSTLRAEWLSGMTGIQQSQVVNWSLFTSCAAEGFTGSQLTMCRQVCEVNQTPTTLTGLIKLYTAIYRTAPPCAR